MTHQTVNDVLGGAGIRFPSKGPEAEKELESLPENARNGRFQHFRYRGVSGKSCISGHSPSPYCVFDPSAYSSVNRQNPELSGVGAA